MWLFTPEGFFSIVVADEFGEEIQVRSRSAEDLDRLRKRFLPALGETVALKGRDYPYRAFTTRADLAACMVKVALAIDYSNFKSAVSKRQSSERAHTYGKVWNACLDIEKENEAKPALTGSAGRGGHPIPNWPETSKNRYGGVVFNPDGLVLVREARGHFDGYHWTFSKGAPNDGETPAEAALRETLEETQHRAEIIGHLEKGYGGTATGWTAYYFVMLDIEGPNDAEAFATNKETQGVRWVSQKEAKGLISQTTNTAGRKRDLAVLADACAAFARLHAV